MKSKISLRKAMKDTWITLWKSLRQILLFGFIFNLLIVVLFRPVLGFIGSAFMRLKGFPILINADIKKFFFSMTGVVMGLVIVTIAVCLVYYEFSVFLLLMEQGKKGEKPSIRYAMERACLSLKSLNHISTAGLAIYSLALLPLLGLGATSSLVSSLTVPRFITGEIERYTGGAIALIAIAVLGAYLFLRLFLVFPMMLFQGMNFKAAAKWSFRHTRKSSWKILVLTGMSVVVPIITSALSLFLLAQLRSAFFLPLKLLSVVLLVLGISLISPINICAMLACYSQIEDFPEFNEAHLEPLDDKVDKATGYIKKKVPILLDKIKTLFERFAPKWLQRHSYLLLIFLLVPVILLGDIVGPYKEESTITVIGHRGSNTYVENTIEAVLSAYEQGADYAEIDVLLSKDNIPMVIHDSSLLRLTGKNEHVWELTAEELQRRVLVSNGQEGRISTLDEMCKATKGKINLLVEFKTHGREEGSIVKQSVRVIVDNAMTKEVQYQTLEQPLLTEMNIWYPEYPMGFIIVSRFGRLSTRNIRNIPANFIGLEQSLVDANVIRACQKAGKPLYVWTVNKVEDVESLVLLGVNGIITDDSTMVIEAIESAKASGNLKSRYTYFKRRISS